MNVLWITNIVLPPLSQHLKMREAIGGGWLYASAVKLVENNSIELSVATVYSGDDLIDVRINGIHYFLLPLHGAKYSQYNKSLEPIWKKIYDLVSPDVVHIHGTEYLHGLAYIRACSAKNVVISIQGLISIISRYYTANLRYSDILKNITIKDILGGSSIFKQQKKMRKQGLLECEYLRSVKHIIGRTTWDRSHVWAINSQANYYHCNETLRSEFYNYTWDYDNCEKHSIFVSQGGYPVKGLHILLKALVLVKNKYPNTKLYVAGQNITDKPWYLMSGYGKIIRNLIKRNNLEDSVIFLGPLNEHEMCNRFLKCNLFVSPSSIENSSNSLGEAQLLGVPYLASYVGGTSDLTDNDSSYLYRFEEIEVLAYKICDIFCNIRENLRNSILVKKYSPELNKNRLFEIYKLVSLSK